MVGALTRSFFAGIALLGMAACGGSWVVTKVPLAVSSHAVGALESVDAAHALESARAMKAKLAGARGAQLERLRRDAVAAYRQVARRYPKSGEVAAEASFRAGELLRAGGENEAAIVELQRAIDTPRGGSFQSRARYELAHILRRSEQFDAALVHFAAVETDRVAPDHQRDLAGLWRAKTLLEMGRSDEAERALRALVARVKDPVDRVRAYDELITILGNSGRLAAAVGHFADVKRLSLALSLEHTERGERMRSAIEGMRCLAVLQRAIAARH